MKKDLAKRLNEVAATMPTVFEWVEIPEVFTGQEMNLSAFGEAETFDERLNYVVMMPCLVAVNHKQQLKDAFKRGGIDEVVKYHRSVMDKIKNDGIRKYAPGLQ